ncbi:copper chaperone PCu(A)C [Cryobacterium sp. MDB2-10]|nr:copper chaperone PCu(A)C [Cryobacterium sp. MDB2-10]
MTTLASLAVVAALALAGCAGTSAPAATTAAAAAADSLSIIDPWLKAADSGMSAAFGTLENAGAVDVTVVSAESPASSMLQLHETVSNAAGEMVMQQKQGGFIVPAGGSLELAPGGSHIMLMGLTNPIKAGDEESFILTLSDGSTLSWTAVAKDYTGANETYTGEMNMETPKK